jgi:hypothetical protein
MKTHHGSSFHSTSLVTESERLQFDLRRAPVSRPKATVERFFAQLARELGEPRPGGTGNAVMTIEQAERLMRGWVTYRDKSSSKLATPAKGNSHGEGRR